MSIDVERIRLSRELLMATILLLLVSNTFMTFAWYGHLKYRSAPLIAAIVVSWLIAFGEYCFQVPANRLGYGQFSGYQLKITQEEPMRWNYALAFVFIFLAAIAAFWGRF
jgi:uncharacterized protein (DUF486 family)